jgi:putative peptidoglycan lipid II flippase
MALASVGLWVTSDQIAAMFSDTSDVGLSDVVSLFALGLVPFGVAFVLQRVFYALGDTRTPFFVQIVQASVFTVGAVLTAYGPTSSIATGLALSLTVSTWVHAVVMGVLLNRRLGRLFDHTELVSFGKFLLAIVPASVVGWLTSAAVSDIASSYFGSYLVENLVVAGVVAISMSVTYVIVLLLVRESITRSLLDALRQRGDDRP